MSKKLKTETVTTDDHHVRHLTDDTPAAASSDAATSVVAPGLQAGDCSQQADLALQLFLRGAAASVMTLQQPAKDHVNRAWRIAGEVLQQIEQLKEST